MRRPRSRKPLRRASSPHPRAQTPPKASMSRAATSPSLGSQPDSQPDWQSCDSTATPYSSWYDTEGYLDEFQKWHVESSFESGQQDQLEFDYSTSQGRELWSRSTQTELCAEGLASNEPVSRVAVEAPPEEHVGEESWFDFRRLLGTPRNRSSFLASMAVLAAVCFTLGVIATLSRKAGTGEKGGNLELIPDAFENEQAAAHEEVDVTMPTTGLQQTVPTTGAVMRDENATTHPRYAPSAAARRKATVSRRRRPATVVLTSRKPPIKARKVGRATRRQRRSKSTTRKRSARSSTSRRSRTTKRKKRRHTAAAKARRRGSGILARRDHVTTEKGQRRSVTTDVPHDSVTEQRKENMTAAVTADHDPTAGLEPGTSSVASRSRTSRRTPPRMSTLDEDDEAV